MDQFDLKSPTDDESKKGLALNRAGRKLTIMTGELRKINENNLFDYNIISVDRGYNSDSEVITLKPFESNQIKFEDFKLLKPIG